MDNRLKFFSPQNISGPSQLKTAMNLLLLKQTGTSLILPGVGQVNNVFLSPFKVTGLPETWITADSIYGAILLVA